MTADLEATTVVQLTDLHIAAPGSAPHGADTAANLRRVAATVREMDLRPAAVLLTGDLSDEGDAASYEHLRELVDDELAVLGCPVLAVVGNHDHRGTFRRIYLGEAHGSDDLPHHYVHDLPGLRLVMCDSYLAGRVTGRLGTSQLEWLDAALGDAGDRTVVVALHHPSVPRGIPRSTDHLLEDRGELGEVLGAHEVGAVLCGHSHASTVATFAGTLHAAAPATAFLFDPSTRGRTRVYEGSGFAICTVRDGVPIVNHHLI